MILKVKHQRKRTSNMIYTNHSIITLIFKKEICFITDKTIKQTDSNENKSKLSSNSSNTNDLINRQEHNVRVTRSNSRLVSLNL